LFAENSCNCVNDGWNWDNPFSLSLQGSQTETKVNLGQRAARSNYSFLLAWASRSALPKLPDLAPASTCNFLTEVIIDKNTMFILVSPNNPISTPISSLTNLTDQNRRPRPNNPRRLLQSRNPSNRRQHKRQIRQQSNPKNRSLYLSLRPSCRFRRTNWSWNWPCEC